MHKVQLSYQLSAERSPNALIRNPLLDLLHAVREHGSISAAARHLGLSYRHVWGALKDAEQSLGHPLIVWEKGQRALLTEFGQKLLWAERQAQARLAPQIEALRGDIERARARGRRRASAAEMTRIGAGSVAKDSAARAAPGALLPVPAQDSCRVDIKLQQHS